MWVKYSHLVLHGSVGGNAICGGVCIFICMGITYAVVVVQRRWLLCERWLRGWKFVCGGGKLVKGDWDGA